MAGGGGRGEGEVQIMLDITLSRGRNNIKNYGVLFSVGEIFLKFSIKIGFKKLTLLFC